MKRSMSNSISSYCSCNSRSEEAHWSSFRGEVLELQQSLVKDLNIIDDGITNNTSTLLSASPSSMSKHSAANKKNIIGVIFSGVEGKKTTSSTRSAVATPSPTKNNRKYYNSQLIISDNDEEGGEQDNLLKENKLPQCQQKLQHQLLSTLEESEDDLDDDNDDSSIEIINANTNTTSQTQHHHLELLGMEEVDKSVCSMNNKSHHNHLSLSVHSQEDGNILNNSSAFNNTLNNATATAASTTIMSHNSQNTNAQLSIATQELAKMKLRLALTEMERDELEFELMQRTASTTT